MFSPGLSHDLIARFFILHVCEIPFGKRGGYLHGAHIPRAVPICTLSRKCFSPSVTKLLPPTLGLWHLQWPLAWVEFDPLFCLSRKRGAFHTSYWILFKQFAYMSTCSGYKQSWDICTAVFMFDPRNLGSQRLWNLLKVTQLSESIVRIKNQSWVTP